MHNKFIMHFLYLPNTWTEQKFEKIIQIQKKTLFLAIFKSLSGGDDGT